MLASMRGPVYGPLPDGPGSGLLGNLKGMRTKDLVCRGHEGPVLAVSAVDDLDGSEYLDYIISGGEDGTARVWLFDASPDARQGETRTYRVWATLSHFEAAPEDGTPPSSTPVVSVCAAPRWAFSGTKCGFLYVWRLQLDGIYQLEALRSRGGVACLAAHDGHAVRAIELMERNEGRRVCTAGGPDGVKIFQVEETNEALTMTCVVHAPMPEMCTARHVSPVPGHPELVFACGRTSATNENPDHPSALWLWSFHETDGENKVKLLAEEPLQTGDNAIAARVTQPARIKGVMQDLRAAVASDADGLYASAQEKGWTATDAAGKGSLRRQSLMSFLDAIVTRKLSPADAEELLLGLGLRHHRHGDIPWDALTSAISNYPEQLCLVAGERALNVFLVDPANVVAPLQWVPEQRTVQPGRFLALDTVGRHAVTTASGVCSVWRLGDWVRVRDSAERFSRQELNNTALVSSHLQVASTTFGRKAGENDQLLCGLQDGSIWVWDMFGETGGEMIAQLRSLTYFEAFVCPFLTMLTMVQLSSSAFEQTIPWNQAAVQLPRRSKVFLDGEWAELLHQRWSLRLSLAFIFKAKVFCTLGLMLCFVIVVTLGIPQFLDREIRRLEAVQRTFFEHLLEELEASDDMPMVRPSSRYSIHKVSIMKKVIESQSTCARVWLALLRVTKRSVPLFTYLCSSILVVPVSRSLASATACVYQDDGPAYLMDAPEITCFEGWHLRLLLWSAPLTLAYFYLVMPYAVVYGDPSYVQQHELLEPQGWRGNAERCVAAAFQGVIHPVKANWFIVSLCDFWQKVLVPVITVRATGFPRRQQGELLVITLFYAIAVLCKPPFADREFCIVYQASAFFVAYVFSCSFFATLWDDDTSLLPVILLLAGGAVIGLCALALVLRKPRRYWITLEMSTQALPGRAKL